MNDATADSLCPCVILQECLSMNHTYKNAFHEYTTSRKGSVKVVSILPSSISDDENNNNPTLLATCRCDTLLSQLSPPSSSSSSSQQQQQEEPTQFLIPTSIVKARNIISKNNDNASSKFFSVCQYDAAASLYHPPASLTNNGDDEMMMSLPFSVVVDRKQFCNFLFREAISNQLNGVLKNIIPPSAAANSKNSNKEKDEEDKDNNNSETIKFLEKVMLPLVLNGLKMACSKNNDDDDDNNNINNNNNPFRELLLNMAPCCAGSSLLPSSHPYHSQLPGGKFECYGPSLFWQVLCTLTVLMKVMPLFAAVEKDEQVEEIIILKSGFYNHQDNGKLTNEPNLFRKAMKLLVSKSLPSLAEIIYSKNDDDDNEQKKEQRIAKWFTPIFRKRTKEDRDVVMREDEVEEVIDDDDDDDKQQEGRRRLYTICLPLLLNARITTGSTDACARGVLPRTPHDLVSSFIQRHALDQVFSVGARALAKHNHRDETENWWNAPTKDPATGKEQLFTVLKGNQAEKNHAALNVLYKKIFSDIDWVNCHMLPHDLVTVEVRCKAGYGARWVAGGEGGAVAVAGAAGDKKEIVKPSTTTRNDNDDDDDDNNDDQDQKDEYTFTANSLAYFEKGLNMYIHHHRVCGKHEEKRRNTEFRGFLEPHSEDGHEKGWRH